MNQSERIVDDKYRAPYKIKRPALIRSPLPSGRGGPALEFGYGSRFIFAMLATTHWKITAVDLDPAGIVDARQRLPEAILGDALSVAKFT